MPHDRFVTPDTVLLKLSDDDWIMVKKRLNIGELRKAEAASLMLIDDGLGGKRWILNPELIGIVDVAIYLVDWSQSAAIKQAALPDVITALQNLEPEDFTEIRTAIHVHERNQQAIFDAEKKTRTGGSASALISALPDTTTGHLKKSEDWMPTLTP